MSLKSIYLIGLCMMTLGQVRAEEPKVTATSRIYCDQPIGKIKPWLNGVSQGGDTATYLKENFVNTVKPLHLSFVRLEAVTGNAFYNLYDPETKKYNWAGLDKEIESIQSTGAEVVANIFYMPKWLSSDPEGKKGDFKMTSPRDYTLWKQYVSDIVRHVNVEKKYGIKYWEIWNEPSGIWAFEPWKHGREPFFHLYDVTAKAIKEADSSAFVGGFGDCVNYPEHYKVFFEYAKAKGMPIDFLSVHWYAEWKQDGWKQPEGFYILAESVKKLHRQYFSKDVPLFMTEWNVNAQKDLKLTPVQQSAYLGQALFWMQEGPVDGANFFRVETYQFAPAVANWQAEVLSAGRILKMFSMLPSDRLNTCDDNEIGAKILAAKDKKQVVAMVSRYDLTASSVKQVLGLVFVNHGYVGKVQAKIYLEDSEGVKKLGLSEPVSTITVEAKVGEHIVVPVELEPYAVAMVVVEASKK